jgi:hypothetical protein
VHGALAVLHAEVLGRHAEAWDARFGLARPAPRAAGRARALLALAAAARA